MIYGFLDTISYLGKALLLLGAYCYFKFYGGLDQDIEEFDEVNQSVLCSVNPN